MAVPGSGELSLLKIAKEKFYDNYDAPDSSTIQSAISLKFVTIGGTGAPMNSGTSFDTTNTASPSHPDNNTGYGMGEFYAYDHDFVPIPCNKAMDVVLVIDYTSSMTDEFNASSTGLKAQVTNITNKVVERSSGDYRLAMVLVDAISSSSTSSLSYSGSSTYSGLPSANKHVQQIGSAARYIHSTAVVKFANTNNTDFANKLNLLAASDNTNGNMSIGSGQSTIGWEVALNQILNNNFAGTFRSGVNRMIIFVTDTSPEGTSTGMFTGAEETTLMGSLSNDAVSGNTSISIIGPIGNTNSNDGTTNTHTVYNGYADNTGGLTNFNTPLDSSNIVTFIGNICNTIETNFATVSTDAESSVGSSGFTMNGNVTADGGSTVTAKGFVRSTSPVDLFIGASGVVNTTVGSGTGTFSSAVTGLSGSTTYYYKAYATNSTGTAYGGGETVTTASSATTPTVTTNNASSITSNSMSLNGNMSSNGGATVTAKGFVYSSTNSNPVLGGFGVSNVTVSNPNTTGAYNRTISSLSSNTTYYIKAYATNSQGTAYGSVRSAQTQTSYVTKYVSGPHSKSLFACYQTINLAIRYTGTFGNGTQVYDSSLNLMNSSNGGDKWYGGPPASSTGGSSSGYFYVNGSGVVSNYAPLGC